jgi:hypothetical protein
VRWHVRFSGRTTAGHPRARQYRVGSNKTKQSTATVVAILACAPNEAAVARLLWRGCCEALAFEALLEVALFEATGWVGRLSRPAVVRPEKADGPPHSARTVSAPNDATSIARCSVVSSNPLGEVMAARDRFRLNSVTARVQCSAFRRITK